MPRQNSFLTISIAALVSIPLTIVSFTVFDIEIGKIFENLCIGNCTQNITSMKEEKTTCLDIYGIRLEKLDKNALPILTGESQIVTGESKMPCKNKSDYECEQLAQLLAERNLSEKVALIVIAYKIAKNQALDEDVICSLTQSLLTNLEIIENKKENDTHFYKLRATVKPF